MAAGSEPVYVPPPARLGGCKFYKEGCVEGSPLGNDPKSYLPPFDVGPLSSLLENRQLMSARDWR